MNRGTSNWSWWRARESGSPLVLKRGPVGAWAPELNSVLDPSMGRCMYAPRWVEPGPAPWGSVLTLPALLLEPVGLLRRTGAWGSARTPLACARARRLLLSEGSQQWTLLPLADPAPKRSWVFGAFATSPLLISLSESRGVSPPTGLIASGGVSPGDLGVVLLLVVSSPGGGGEGRWPLFPRWPGSQLPSAPRDPGSAAALARCCS